MKRRTISSRVYLVVSVLVLLLMSIQMALYQTTVGSIEYQQRQTISATVKELSGSLGRKTKTLTQLARRMVNKDKISESLISMKQEGNAVKMKLGSLMKDYNAFLGDTVYLSFFDEDDFWEVSTGLSSDEVGQIKESYETYRKEEGWQLNAGYQFFKVDSNRYNEVYIVYFYPIWNWSVSDTTARIRIGTLAFCCKQNVKSLMLSEQALQNTRITLSQRDRDDTVYLIDYQPENKKEKPVAEGSEPVSYSDISWRIQYTLYPNSTILNLNKMRNLIILDIVVILCMFFWLAFEFRYSIAKPLKKLIDYMESYKIDGDQTPLVMRSRTEIGLISDHMNELLSKNKQASQQLMDLQYDLYEASLEKVSLEFQSLQQQINPHFFFNTLECVHSLAVVNQIPDIENIVCSLSNVMRYAARGKQVVTVREEMAMVREYLGIMQFRFPNQFEIQLDISDEIQNCSIPKMTLQPLFENAFKYSRQMNRTVHILARSEHTDELVKIIVRDDGRGITEENLRNLRQFLQAERVPDEHVGLYNVHRRVKLHCGEGFGLLIESVPDTFTEVTVLLANKQMTE